MMRASGTAIDDMMAGGAASEGVKGEGKGTGCGCEDRLN